MCALITGRIDAVKLDVSSNDAGVIDLLPRYVVLSYMDDHPYRCLTRHEPPNLCTNSVFY